MGGSRGEWGTGEWGLGTSLTWLAVQLDTVAPIAPQVEGRTGTLVPTSRGQQAEAAAAAAVDLARVVGHCRGKRVSGWQTDPGYGPLLPRLPASGGVRAVLTGNTFSGLLVPPSPSVLAEVG